jgi:GxxExxY protein
LAPAYWRTPTSAGLCYEFERHAIPHARQVELPLQYDDLRLNCGYRADIVVCDQVIIEIKSVDRILSVHEAQLLTYLRISPYRIGLLLNFNTLSLKDGIRRRIV